MQYDASDWDQLEIHTKWLCLCLDAVYFGLLLSYASILIHIQLESIYAWFLGYDGATRTKFIPLDMHIYFVEMLCETQQGRINIHCCERHGWTHSGNAIVILWYLRIVSKPFTDAISIVCESFSLSLCVPECRLPLTHTLEKTKQTTQLSYIFRYFGK